MKVRYYISGTIFIVALVSVFIFSLENEKHSDLEIPEYSIVASEVVPGTPDFIFSGSVEAGSFVDAGGVTTGGDGDGSAIDRVLPDFTLPSGEGFREAIQVSDTSYVVLSSAHKLYLVNPTGIVASTTLTSAGISYKLFRFPGSASNFGVLFQTNSCDSFGCYYYTYVYKFNSSLGLLNTSPSLANGGSYSNVDHDQFKELIPAPNGGFYTIVLYQPYGGSAAMKVKRYTSSCTLDTTFGTSGEMTYSSFDSTMGEAKGYNASQVAIKTTNYGVYSGGQYWPRFEVRNLSNFSLAVGPVNLPNGTRLVASRGADFLTPSGGIYNSSLTYIGALPMPYGAFTLPTYNVGAVFDMGSSQLAGLQNGRLIYYSGSSWIGPARIMTFPYQKSGLSGISYFSGSIYGYAIQSNTNGDLNVFSMKYAP